MTQLPGRSSRSGFTLIELLVSSVLTAILMLMAARVMRMVARDTQQTVAQQATQQSVLLLEEQLRRDLRNAQGMLIEPQQLRLYGFLSRDPLTQLATHRPALVVYRVVPYQKTGLLLRHETALRGEGPPSRPQTSVLWRGVSRLQVIANVIADDDETAPGTLLEATGGLPPMPPSVRVLLWDDRGTSLLSARVEHHRET